ncbi:LPXTG cell wall anchor domain-containing protein [Streptomyces monticola]|uniref:LPXTG cell wall anchor domain-containing protein n=1 Tax=Streptomyces monticola TaxID=2666263 RepID=A0ABW2JFI6_9ACTN
MKLRRTLTVAVAAAVATPLALTAAAPAVAATARIQDQPTYAELEKAAADADKAYKKAAAAEEQGRKDVEAEMAALDSDTHPLKAASLAADKAAKEAAEARTAAEQAVTDAEAALEAATTEAEKAAAQKALDEAEAARDKAVEAEREAKEKAKAARTALDDARVAALRKYNLVKEARKKALAAKEAADTALAEAKKCVRENGLTSRAVGLPSKVVAGTTVDFTLRVTNGTERTVSVDPLVFVNAQGGQQELLKTQWYDGSGWQTLKGDEPEHLDRIETMKPDARTDLKLRLKVAAKAKSGDALALFAADAFDAYKPCVLGVMARYDFKLLPAGSKPGDVDDAEPGKPAENDDQRPGAAKPGSGTSAQGGSSKQPAAAGAEAEGDLATTGSSGVTPIALAGAAAVALGAGAVFVVRRRKATDN